PAGLFKNPGVELFGLRLREAPMDAVSQTGCRVVQGFLISVADPFVAGQTGCDVFRRLGNQPLVGVGFIGGLGVALVAFRTAAFQMNVIRQTFGSDPETFVNLRDPRRRTGSTVTPFAFRHVVIVIADQSLQLVRAAVAVQTGIRRRRRKQDDRGEERNRENNRNRKYNKKNFTHKQPSDFNKTVFNPW
ncbi:MAG: hypothetical protein K4445_07125, partial [Deltaproteobacteria bacterium]